MELFYKLILCHFIGDYFLQNDFIAQTKGKNTWHLIAHCFMYTLPFYLFFGFNARITFLIGWHILIDALKGSGRINYIADQILHILALGVYFIPWYI